MSNRQARSPIPAARDAAPVWNIAVPARPGRLAGVRMAGFTSRANGLVDAQLIRFDHAAHRLAAGHSAALVAAESGYTDQSHLHRDVRTFAGVTPRAVATAPWLSVDDIAWAESGTFLQDTR
jgi:AraC-like DNA-binding protein